MIFISPNLYMPHEIPSEINTEDKGRIINDPRMKVFYVIAEDHNIP